MAKILPELKLRTYLEQRMRPHWMMTWHEDREISPGVPDLHYVVNDYRDAGDKYRVGWLELKATDLPLSGRNKIGVEPSQHQYIRRWVPHMPIHFFIRVVDHIFIVNGSHHKELPNAASELDIRLLSQTDFHQSQIAELLPPFLRSITII